MSAYRYSENKLQWNTSQNFHKNTSAFWKSFLHISYNLKEMISAKDFFMEILCILWG